MYQFSLSWFYNVFQSCLGGEKSAKGNNRRNSMMSAFSGLTSRSNSATAKLLHVQPSYLSLNSQVNEDIIEEDSSELLDNDFDYNIESIISHLTYTVYQVVSWAMFAEHKLIFSFSISVNILKHETEIFEKITVKEFNFFLNSTLLADMQLDFLNDKIKEEMKDFKFPNELLIDDKMLRQLVLLEMTLPNKFQNLCSNMEQNLELLWKKFVNSNDPYDFMSIEGKFCKINKNHLDI
jgi:hypothetical protein